MKSFKGIKYTCTTEQIKEYMKLSTEQKLKWLDEIQQFNELVMDEKTKKIREMFRKAEI